MSFQVSGNRDFLQLSLSTRLYSQTCLKQPLKRIFKTDNHLMQVKSIEKYMLWGSRKNGNFQMKKCDIFLIFAQNIDL